MFKEICNIGRSDFIKEVINSINKYSWHNRRFAKILNMKNLDELNTMTLTYKSLNELKDELDLYRNHILGTEHDTVEFLAKHIVEAQRIHNAIQKLN